MERITCIKILDETAKPQKEVPEVAQGFNLPKHMAEHIYMFRGQSVRVKFKTQADMMSQLIDWFGKDFTVRKDGEERIIVTLSCNEEAFCYWALQYGAYVEVLEPTALRENC